MSTYKVIQDIEAEDKLLGPLTLRQFIYAGVAAVCLYLSFLCFQKSIGFMAVIFLPVAAFTGFFAFPFSRDQPTEVWALAKIRFMVKPRRRIWDQSGVKELVSITAPKHVEQPRTNGLSEGEVQSRLQALADTIDSRGWAIKNAAVSVGGVAALPASDRLFMPAAPQEVSDLDVRASDDILDEYNNPVARNFDSMITASSQQRHQQLVARMLTPDPAPVAAPAPTATQPSNGYYFMNPAAAVPGQAAFQNTPMAVPAAPAIPQAAVPTADEEALVAKFKAESASQQIAYGHLKRLQPLSEQSAAAAPPAVELSNNAVQKPAKAPGTSAKAKKPAVTPQEQAAIINLAHRDDLDVATIQRQADEVVISLH